MIKLPRHDCVHRGANKETDLVKCVIIFQMIQVYVFDDNNSEKDYENFTCLMRVKFIENISDLRTCVFVASRIISSMYF